MNNDAFINNLAFITGCSRKQVLEALKQMSKMPEVKKEISRLKHA